MSNEQTIQCVFCGGSGRHPYYFTTSCPVCKGKGENAVAREIDRCTYCKGSGRKSTTTLTCFYCCGLGVVARAKLAVGSQRVDKDAIEEVVEEILKKYKGGGPGIERIPVSGLLRRKEMAYVEPIAELNKARDPKSSSIFKDVKKRANSRSDSGWTKRL